MNKKQQIIVNLNTINIAYPKKTDSRLFQKIAGPPVLKLNQIESQRFITQSQVSTIEPSQEPTIDSSFNDSNIKYGKSQTVQNSYFHRLRIHLHRKEKKSKWLDLPSHEDTITTKDFLDNNTVQYKEYLVKRQTRTSLSKRELIQPEGGYKIQIFQPKKGKQNSISQRKERSSSILHDNVVLKQMEKPVKDIRLSKLDELLKQTKIKYEGKKNPHHHHQIRHLSDNSTQINKRIAKLEIRNKMPFKVQNIPQKEILAIKMGEDDENKSKDFRFEAWDSVDIFSTNKNGIVEYTIEQQNSHSPEIAVSMRQSKKKYLKP